MKTQFDNIQSQRVYVRNFINRHYTGEKRCVLCGKEPTTIVHNEDNPFLISFICDSCRAKTNKHFLSDLPKVNILEQTDTNKRYSHVKNLILTEDLKNILKNALKTNLSLTEYLRQNELSYNKYKKAIELYEKNGDLIEDDLTEHFKELRNSNISKTKTSHKN